MKKVFTLLTIVCFVASISLFSSCTKSQEDLIVGTWKCTTATCTPYTQLINIYLDFTMVFNADKSMSATMMGRTENGTYTIEGDKLTTDFAGNTTPMDIKKLDNKKLSVSFVNESRDDEGNPITYVYELDFDRQ